ncbi:MAG TPA: hypothetical protein VHC90_00335 [Bryobacteraceae bacterium]|nr:hypothetical protein [Bryobacteraceae bacterium]
MGNLVWTTPAALHLQINRVDVYGNDCTTNSFFERHHDYCGGCGYADIDFGGEGVEPFPDSGFTQHLAVYDGELAIDANGVKLAAVATPLSDVMAISVQNSRPKRGPVAIVLRPHRYQTKYFGAQLETYGIMWSTSRPSATQLLPQRNHAADACAGAFEDADRGRVTGPRRGRPLSDSQRLLTTA